MVSFYLPALMTGSPDRDSLIVRYFELGFSYKEIIGRSLAPIIAYEYPCVILKGYYLQGDVTEQKITQIFPLREVVDAVERELDGSGGEVGYRHMHQILLTKHISLLHQERLCEKR
jgi:hypothetical protein